MQKDEAGLRVKGDQPEAARLLARAYEETRRLGRHEDRPTLAEISDTLALLSDTLGGLRHWDIRPARTVSLLASLAEFLGDAPVEDEGLALFGDLPLPALETLAEDWAATLDPAWIGAKTALRAPGKKTAEIPDYLGLDAVVKRFRQGNTVDVGAARARLAARLQACRDMSRGRETDLRDRVAVVLHARAT